SRTMTWRGGRGFRSAFPESLTRLRQPIGADHRTWSNASSTFTPPVASTELCPVPDSGFWLPLLQQLSWESPDSPGVLSAPPAIRCSCAGLWSRLDWPRCATQPAAIMLRLRHSWIESEDQSFSSRCRVLEAME